MEAQSQASERASGRSKVGGRYELLHELASGGMATVHVARAHGAAGFGRLVAVKCCHKHLRGDEDFARMFLDEARLVAELRHPNVVATLDFGEDEALSLFIVMEYVDGFSVQQLNRLAKHKGAKMPAPIALRIVIDALMGLQAAHDHRDPLGNPLHIVHRDVSPQNILCGTDGVSRIMDFGIARAESRLAHTRDGNIKGKAAYMAPEQHGLLMDDPPPLTHRADLYAMGVVLWELLVGKRLFQRENDAQTLAASIRGDYLPATDHDPALPAAIDVIIATALKRNPDERYADGNSFIDAIERCGLAPASSREVGRWVREVAREQLEKRESALRALADRTPDDAESVLDRAMTSASNAELRREYGAHAPDEMAANERTPTPKRRRSAFVVPAIVASTLLLLLGVSYAALRTPSTAAHRADTPPPPSAAIASSAQPSPSGSGASSVEHSEPRQGTESPTQAPPTNETNGATAPAVDTTRRPPPLDPAAVRTAPRRRPSNAFRPRFL